MLHLPLLHSLNPSIFWQNANRPFDPVQSYARPYIEWNDNANYSAEDALRYAYNIVQPAPEGKGAARGMQLAIEDAGLAGEDFDYIKSIMMPELEHLIGADGG